MTKTKEQLAHILPRDLKEARIEQQKRTTVERRQADLKRTIDRTVRIIRAYGSVKDPNQPMKIHEVTLNGIHVDKEIDASIHMSYLENGSMPVDSSVLDVVFSDRRSTADKPLRSTTYKLQTNCIEYYVSNMQPSEVKVSDGRFDQEHILVKQVLTLVERKLRAGTNRGKE